MIAPTGRAPLWSVAEDEFIVDLYRNRRDLTIRQIAERLSVSIGGMRTFKAVRDRLNGLGLNSRSLESWPEARIANLKRLWADKLSASEIAKELGTSRNAVLGKAHRLNLEARAPRNAVRKVQTKGARPVGRPSDPKKFVAPKLAAGTSKTSPIYRGQLPPAPQMSSAALRALLADAVRNTAAMQTEGAL